MTKLPWLDPEELYFPDTCTALEDPNGLLAAGGDLSPKRLIYAYQHGIFPWFEAGDVILWWSPSPRAVLFPPKIHVSKSLAKCIRRKQFTVSCDLAFTAVIQHCANSPRKNQAGTWITEEMVEAYTDLHHQGHAHSIEVWKDDTLVGGLYGLGIGKIFFGESMFSHTTDASKVAFASLAQNLQRWGYPLIDCQVSNPHLTSLGSEDIKRADFNRYLHNYTRQKGLQNWQENWQDFHDN